LFDPPFSLRYGDTSACVLEDDNPAKKVHKKERIKKERILKEHLV